MLLAHLNGAIQSVEKGSPLVANTGKRAALDEGLKRGLVQHRPTRARPRPRHDTFTEIEQGGERQRIVGPWDRAIQTRVLFPSIP